MTIPLKEDENGEKLVDIEALVADAVTEIDRLLYEEANICIDIAATNLRYFFFNGPPEFYEALGNGHALAKVFDDVLNGESDAPPQYNPFLHRFFAREAGALWHFIWIHRTLIDPRFKDSDLGEHLADKGFADGLLENSIVPSLRIAIPEQLTILIESNGITDEHLDKHLTGFSIKGSEVIDELTSHSSSTTNADDGVYRITTAAAKKLRDGLNASAKDANKDFKPLKLNDLFPFLIDHRFKYNKKELYRSTYEKKNPRFKKKFDKTKKVYLVQEPRRNQILKFDDGNLLPEL